MNKRIKRLSSILCAMLILAVCIIPVKAEVYVDEVQTQIVDNSVCECKRDINATLTIHYTEDETPLVYEIKEIVYGDSVVAFKNVEDTASLEAIDKIKKDFEKFAKRAGFDGVLEFNSTSTHIRSFDNREYSMVTTGGEGEEVSRHMLIEGNYGVEMEYTLAAEVTVTGSKPEPTVAPEPTESPENPTDKPVETPTDKPTKAPSKDTALPEEASASLLWLWIILAIVLILAAGFTAYKLVVKKKQK